MVLAKPLADVNNAWKNVIGLVGVGLAVGLLVAFILATFVARRITQPLRVIGSAADKVARGDLDVNVVGKRTSDDELGQLATRFQGMVDRLREVDELERNFLMRVTHELRTPLTAISGHVQAVTEGVVEPGTSWTSRSTAVNEEVRRLDRLVGDLLDLTRLEAHQFRVVREEVGPRGAARAGRRGVPREGPRRTTSSSTRRSTARRRSSPTATASCRS